MSLHAGIETLDFEYEDGQRPVRHDGQLPAGSGQRPARGFPPVLVGVVGSGNLEVLLEPADDVRCSVHVETSARGFGAIWRAVIDDFHARHPLTGVRVSINDMGATPAVVSLRLDQAVAELAQEEKGDRP